MPAPAVIPALLVYINIVVFKTFVASSRAMGMKSEQADVRTYATSVGKYDISRTSVFLLLL